MSEASETSENPPSSFEEIVAYCRRVQWEYSLIEAARRDRRKHELILAEFCRRCSDPSCPDSCEVKKTYNILR